MQQIKLEIKQLETMIFIYSDRDQVRVKQLEQRLFDLNMILLELMSEVK